MIVVTQAFRMLFALCAGTMIQFQKAEASHASTERMSTPRCATPGRWWAVQKQSGKTGEFRRLMGRRRLIEMEKVAEAHGNRTHQGRLST
ncbi:MAG TPA: hypothetical protein PLK89_07560, partial [Acidobacteriota bacterium]|nr:hypothetical protein [Acidobacteriota bacterium]